MRSGAPFVWSFAGLRHASPCALLAIVVGCSHNGSNYPQLLADRIFAPPDAVSATSEEGLPKPKAVEDEATEPDETRRTAVPMPRGPDAPTSQGAQRQHTWQSAHPARRHRPGVPAPAPAEGVPGEHSAGARAGGHRLRGLPAGPDQRLLGRGLPHRRGRGGVADPRNSARLHLRALHSARSPSA